MFLSHRGNKQWMEFIKQIFGRGSSQNDTSKLSCQFWYNIEVSIDNQANWKNYYGKVSNLSPLIGRTLVSGILGLPEH